MTTRLSDDREIALKVGYAATDWHVPFTYEQYEAITADWDVKTIVRDDEVIGAAYFKNGETHVSILPEWRKRWLTKSILKDLLAATKRTQVTPGHEYMYNILNRIGFTPSADGTLIREI